MKHLSSISNQERMKQKKQKKCYLISKQDNLKSIKVKVAPKKKKKFKPNLNI